jgi:hypothetical protein
MVLHPLPSGERGQRHRTPTPAWQAVERKQIQVAQDWWLVTQADHAALAGDLAARLDFPAIPALSSEVIRAIAAHDAGWTQFDAAVTTSRVSPPKSFLAISPAQFLIAWADSIRAAEEIGAIAGIIVSEHFSRLARTRLASRADSPEDVQRLEAFLSHEGRRQAQVGRQVNESASVLEVLTDVLQFCDLVSLYLCCGAEQAAEFPQDFDGLKIRVHCEGDAFLFTPPVFGQGAALGISAYRYASNQVGILPFLLA